MREAGKHLYAILLKRPGSQLELNTVQAIPGSKVNLLDHEGSLPWKATGDGLVIDFPANARESLGYIIKIEAMK